MEAEHPFRDRSHAGKVLAGLLAEYAGPAEVLVLGLPRGGVPVAYEVARELNKPLDVFIVRKLGVPGHEELAMGAMASGGAHLLNDEVVRRLGIPAEAVARVMRREEAELQRRDREYRGDRPFPPVEGRIVIVVDDGLATGSTMRAAAMALRQRGPAEIIVAVPVAGRDTCREFRAEVDRIICALTPEPFYAVGAWYEDFSQTTDEEVRQLLRKASRPDPEIHPTSAAGEAQQVFHDGR